jgi:integration host factor subunit beta
MPVKKYTKADIIDSLYEKTEISRNDIRLCLDLFVDEIKEALIRREVIELRGFGTFEVIIRKARPNARNPKTGENIVIGSHGAVSFRCGADLKKTVRAIHG